jgi:DNA-3-methyladenine glycosylase II
MIDIAAARAHFIHRDRVLADELNRLTTDDTSFTVPQAVDPEEYFARICRSIVGQQLSVKAAATIWNRCETLLGTVTPEAILRQDTAALRSAGLSAQKAKYLTHIAQEVYSGAVDLSQLHTLHDEAVIAELTKLYGIGRWSAEMFLMFSLARPDVFSYGDLGLKMGFIALYGHPVSDTIVESWSPHRTTAALVLWHYKDNRPDPT